MLKGLILCHECGHPLAVVNRPNRSGADVLYFVCRTYQRDTRSGVCTSHCIKEKTVTEAVWAKIQEICADALDLQILRPLAEQAVREAEQAAQRQIQLQTEYEDFSLKMDEELMESLIVNLTDNALHATEPGGYIILKAYKESGKKILEVADNGRGIPQEEMGKITEAFYMVDKSRSRQEGGAGLGLALCVKIAEVHGARLDIVSQIGAGTKVRVIFDKKDKELT